MQDVASSNVVGTCAEVASVRKTAVVVVSVSVAACSVAVSVRDSQCGQFVADRVFTVRGHVVWSMGCQEAASIRHRVSWLDGRSRSRYSLSDTQMGGRRRRDAATDCWWRHVISQCLHGADHAAAVQLIKYTAAAAVRRSAAGSVVATVGRTAE